MFSLGSNRPQRLCHPRAGRNRPQKACHSCAGQREGVESMLSEAVIIGFNFFVPPPIDSMLPHIPPQE